jgi:hypothetical protein
MAFRYLERPLLESLPGMLLPGAVALVRTFRHVPGHAGLPARRHQLEPGELLRLLPETHFHILVHQEDYDDDGLPMAGIVARRRLT